jgi:hypothetical protein
MIGDWTDYISSETQKSYGGYLKAYMSTYQERIAHFQKQWKNLQAEDIPLVLCTMTITDYASELYKEALEEALKC